MLHRCYQKKSASYSRYGGAGIRVCRAWKKNFVQFLRDMGECPSNLHSLERKNNYKGYSAQNCCWILKVDQVKNRRSNIFVTWNGRTEYLAEWGRILGISMAALNARYHRGHRPPALFQPIRKIGGRYYSFAA